MDGLFGFTANIISTALVHPIDVVKTNYQLRRATMPETVPNIVRDIWKSRGIRGFYAGLAPNLATYPVFWATYFGSDQIFRKRKIVENKFIDGFIKSYAAATIGSTLSNPLFVLKTRMQDEKRAKGLYATLHDTNRLGFRAYFRGIGSTYLNNLKLGIQFPMYDMIKSHTDSVVIASLGSKLISSSILYPLDLIRVNQRNSDAPIRLYDVGKKIVRHDGFRGLYRGVVLYNAVSAPNFVMMMVILENFRILSKYFG